MIRARNTIVGVVLAGTVGTLGVGGVAGAATSLTATMKGSNEVPKAGNGSGTAKLTLDDKKGRVCYQFTLKNIRTPTAAHIHKGTATVAGPVVVPLFTTPTSKLKGCVRAKTSLIKAIEKSPAQYYVNVHTAKYPAGAARGQLH
jgi:CHRD domain-containing protein